MIRGLGTQSRAYLGMHSFGSLVKGRSRLKNQGKRTGVTHLAIRKWCDHVQGWRCNSRDVVRELHYIHTDIM